MNKQVTSLLMILFFVLPAFAISATETKAPLFENLGNLHHKVTTKNEMAQRFFDQGLTLSYAFNHKEAERSFREAVRLDPDLAMAYWGIALVLGPNYNMAMEKDAVHPAYEAIQKALELAPKASEKEQAYINALSKRYIAKPPQDRKPLDQAYSDAMRKVAKQYPDDPDASALFAESLMNLHPWDLWTREGEPKEWTPEILSVLEKGMKQWPEHPGFLHFYIHAVEASKDPDRGLDAAARLPKVVPGAGHLVHMPAHIYIRVGRYLDSVAANEEAIKADDAYATACSNQGVYAIGYMPHNHHFLTASAMLAGQSAKSLSAARHLSMHQDQKLMREPGFGASIQHYWITPLYVLVRFGKWEEILKEPAPEKDLLYPTGIWHYARGMAFLRTNRMEEAKEELASLKSIAENPQMIEQRIWEINSTAEVLQIAHHVLAGEIAAVEKDFDSAIAHLQKGVEIEDGLMYQEPADWNASVRQNLGAVLLAAGRPAEAEKVYRKDLEYVRETGWSLFGLAKALRAQGKNEEAEQIEQRFQKAWSQADVKLITSRF